MSKQDNQPNREEDKMGWMCFNQRFKDKKQFAEFIVDRFKGYQTESQEQGDIYWNVISTSLTGNTLLIFAERINSLGQKEKDIFIYLLGQSKGEYRYKDIDAFCGPYDEVPLAKKWHDWFLSDNALLCDDEQTKWAKNWVSNCYQKTLDGKVKSSHKKQLMELLNAQKSVPVRLRILDQRQVTLVGTLSRGRTAEIIDKDGRYKSCKWNYLELME